MSLGRGYITTSFTSGMPFSSSRLDLNRTIHCVQRAPRRTLVGARLAHLLLLLQLSFCLEPIVQVASVCATAFEVQLVRSVPDFLQARCVTDLQLRLLRFTHLLFPVFHTCRHGFRLHIF